MPQKLCRVRQALKGWISPKVTKVAVLLLPASFDGLSIRLNLHAKHGQGRAHTAQCICEQLEDGCNEPAGEGILENQ